MILTKRRSQAWAAGEPACRPGSVHPLARAGGHPSGTAVAGSLVRSTREHRAGHPQTLAQEAGASLLTLLRVGFTEPPGSLRALVVSYTTVSPLPRTWPKPGPGRSVLCGTVPRVTPGRCYRPPCPVEPGPSSPGHARTARRGRPAGSPFPPRIGACAPRVTNSPSPGHERDGGFTTGRPCRKAAARRSRHRSRARSRCRPAP
jgi:hypothetical protein